MIDIDKLTAIEILDSRSRPTLSVTLVLGDGSCVCAGVPSGASTGTREALELRDGDADRFSGSGVKRAVGYVGGEIADLLAGRTWSSQREVDQALVELDGTDNKGRLGANAIVGVSMAVARAFAEAESRPLYETLQPTDVQPKLPVPHFNVLNGGSHAQNDLAFQEFMIAPLGAPNVREAIRAGAEIYGRLRSLLRERGMSTGLGDEGGFAPEIAEPEEVLALLVEAISTSGYEPGRSGVAIALDPAASAFRTEEETYEVGREKLTSSEMIERYRMMVDRFPVWSIEDGLGEDDRDGWIELTRELGERIQLVGDDNFVTNPGIIREAIGAGIANAALIKLNQVGTVTETLEAMAVCRAAGYAQMVSHRSGETTDDFIADLAVATGCGQLKSGAPARSERVAKYNRLIEIELGSDLPFGLE